MAKTNYSFEKRQRELAKKKKQEAKRLRKSTRGTPAETPDKEQATEGTLPPAETQTSG